MSKNLMLHRTKCDIDLKIQNESGKPDVTIRCLGMTMKDIVVDLDLGSPEEDALLSATLDAFVIEQLERDADEGPEMMVRTAFRPTGEMCKEIVFQPEMGRSFPILLGKPENAGLRRLSVQFASRMA